MVGGGENCLGVLSKEAGNTEAAERIDKEMWEKRGKLLLFVNKVRKGHEKETGYVVGKKADKDTANTKTKVVDFTEFH